MIKYVILFFIMINISRPLHNFATKIGETLSRWILFSHLSMSPSSREIYIVSQKFVIKILMADSPEHILRWKS